MGHVIGGRKVTYAVPDDTIDMLWFIHGRNLHLKLQYADALPRFSDHRARRALIRFRPKSV